MRYHVKNADGQELVVPSLRELHDLYVHGFLEDGDLVRADTSEVWVRAGAMRALQGVRERRAEPRRMGVIVAAVVALAIALGILLR